MAMVTSSTPCVRAQVFAELEGQRERLQVENIQLSMSTLEDVFLRIAKESEVEAARKEQVGHSSPDVQCSGVQTCGEGHGGQRVSGTNDRALTSF